MRKASADMTYDISSLPVNFNKCRTCPFAQSHESAIALQNTIIARMLNDGGSQICHGTEGANREPRSFCRGARDRMLTLFYRMQFIDAATDEAWDAKRQELGVQEIATLLDS
jgi:hypothetical protein